MSLRARLTASFAVILALPLVAAVFVVHGAIVSLVGAEQRSELDAAFSAGTALYSATSDATEAAVEQAAEQLARRSDGVRAFSDTATASLVASQLRGSLGIVALVRPDRSTAGVAAGQPRFLPGSSPPPVADVLAKRPNGWAVFTEVPVTVGCGRGCVRLLGRVVGGTWLDQTFINRLSGTNAELTVLVDGRATASTSLRSSQTVSLRGRGVRGTLAGETVFVERGPLAQGVPRLHLLVSDEPGRDAGSITWPLALMFLLALAAGTSLAYLLARYYTRPIAELSAAALAVSRGDFHRRIESDTHDEFGELADAFNTMTEHLQAYVGELEESRDEIRRSVRRLGQTLQSTHDLTKLLSVVLETALVAVQGRAGAVYLLGATRNDLYVKVGRNLGHTGRKRIPVGEGIAGRVVHERRPILVPSAEGVIRPHNAEPQMETAICVPLESQGQLLGVIALYGRDDAHTFAPGDLETIRSLAQQAAVGIENVLLHQEAQRLSITDGLTGAWNYRYFQMRLAQEVERAIRFNRPFSMMIVDIDHFKSVNDTYGHQRGDSVLVEVARRMVGVVRVQVDTLARYGGEEFVLLLPETPVDGARVVAEKIRESMATETFGHEGEQPVRVTVSIGLATFPEHGSTTRTLIRAADQALYEAKARGRNQVVTAEELDSAGIEERHAQAGAPPVAEDASRLRLIKDEDSTPPPNRP